MWFAGLSGRLRVGQQDCTRTIVFCNKIETCRKVENLLNRNGEDPSEEGLLVLPYHAAIEEVARSKALKVSHAFAAVVLEPTPLPLFLGGTGTGSIY